MCLMTETQIVTAAYYIIEKGNDPWSSSDDEYIMARNYANAAVNRWEFYDQTKWKDLYTTLAAAATGTKTTTAGTATYACPDDMRYPATYVRTITGGSSTFWQVISPEASGEYVNSQIRVCWFTGSIKTGFTLHFNPNVGLTTGNTIAYEYYKIATQFSTTTDVTEMQDPYFIVYYIAAHFAEIAVDPDYNNMAEARLEQMRTQNMSQLFAVSEDIPTSLDSMGGFGI